MSAEGTIHLSDEEALRVADGQPVAPARLAHCERCESCAARVADLALTALSVHQGLTALAAAPGPEVAGARAPSPSPALPLALGLAVALAASIPIFPSAARTLASLAAGREVHAAALGDLARAAWSSAHDPALSITTTVLLLVVASVLAFAASRRARATSDRGVPT